MVRTADPVPPRLILVGATGALGTALLELIGEEYFSYGELLLCASPARTGDRPLVGGVPHEVRHPKASEAARSSAPGTRSAARGRGRRRGSARW
jgi:aspartate-semialdehyde dehydrogenase